MTKGPRVERLKDAVIRELNGANQVVIICLPLSITMSGLTLETNPPRMPSLGTTKNTRAPYQTFVRSRNSVPAQTVLPFRVSDAPRRFRVVMVMHPGFDRTEFRDLLYPLKPFAASLEVTHMPNSAGSGDSQLCRSRHRQRVQCRSPSTTSATSQTSPSANISNRMRQPRQSRNY